MKKSIVLLFGNNLSIKLTSMFFSLYLAKTLGPTILGSYVLYISLFGIGAFLSKLGIHYALEKRISEIRRDEKEIVSTGFIVNCGLLFLTAVLVLVFHNQIEQFIGIEHTAYYLLACIVLSNLNGFTSAILRGNKKISTYSHVLFLKEISPKLLAMPALLFFKDVHILFLSIVVGEALALLYSLFFIKINAVSPNKASFHALYDLTKYNAGLELRALTFNWVDIWVIGLFLSKDYVGIYQVAWQISSSVLIVSKTLTTAYFPYFSEWAANHRIDKLKDYIYRRTIPYLLLPIPLFAGSFIYGSEVMQLFGNQFSEGAAALTILLVCTVARSLQELISKVLVAIDQSKLSFVASSYTGIMNILLNFLFVYLWGITGAAISTTLSSIANMVICWYFLNKVMGAKFNIRTLIPNAASSTIMLIVLLGMKEWVQVPNVFIAIAVGLFCWGVGISMSKSYRMEMLSFVRRDKRIKGESVDVA